MSLEDAHELAGKIHRENTKKVVDLLKKDYDLRNLSSVIDPTTADVYQRVLPKYAELCELDQAKGLNAAQKAELAVCYASLYPTFGDRGIVEVALQHGS